MIAERLDNFWFVVGKVLRCHAAKISGDSGLPKQGLNFSALQALFLLVYFWADDFKNYP
jgi:hypothetical protein